ncbi:helix-turn-helix domain-containing protein [Bacillus sp. FJAT-27916]|uniref:helix-turn-helix domain-containing protein n=1 Tax=Bacillus sp. FJAT-27916 TaxID=1679169 RepID=UPI0009E4BA2F|nr:helix-turn-helix domain-containing protein [Bacillus sp. FJAT-27916]
MSNHVEWGEFIITYIDGLILYLIKVLKGQRTVYSPLHILNGKRSSQPIQDARLYGLDPFFAVLPKLSREEWDEHLRFLKERELIEPVGDLTYICSDAGLAFLDEWREQYEPMSHLNGFLFKETAPLFWARLQLLVQVLSNMVHENHSFIPVQRNLDHQRFVKSWLKQHGKNLRKFSRELYEELHHCLDRLHGASPELFVMLLSGHERAGMTLSQAARKLGIDHYYAQFLFLDTLHYMIESARKEPFPLLNSLLVQEEQNESVLTNSTKMTWKLVRQGLTIEQIARARRLKINTVEDHIVEIASFIEGFSIEDYVTDEEQRQIVEAANSVHTGQLRSIKELLPPGVPYFKIRLVMTKWKRGDQHGNA